MLSTGASTTQDPEDVTATVENDSAKIRETIVVNKRLSTSSFPSAVHQSRAGVDPLSLVPLVSPGNEVESIEYFHLKLST